MESTNLLNYHIISTVGPQGRSLHETLPTFRPWHTKTDLGQENGEIEYHWLSAFSAHASVHPPLSLCLSVFLSLSLCLSVSLSLSLSLSLSVLFTSAPEADT